MHTKLWNLETSYKKAADMTKATGEGLDTDDEVKSFAGMFLYTLFY